MYRAQNKNEFATIISVSKLLKTARSEITRGNWRNSLYHFFNFTEIHPDEFVKLDKQFIEEKIISYVDHLKERVGKGELNPNTIVPFVSPLVGFLTFNHVDGMNEAWVRIKANYPEKIRSQDKKYDENQLQKMYQFANIRQKSILGLLLSGMRIGALKDLKFEDINPTENWAAITVYRGTRFEYTTFITPQAYKDITEYVEHRKRNGETITRESPLIRNEYQPGMAGEWVDGNDKKHGPEPLMTSIGAAHIVSKIVLNSGVMVNSHDSKKRHSVMTCHGFRKYNNTVMKASGMDSERVEMLLGHSNSSLSGHYWRLPTNELEMSPQELKLYQTIKSEYKKCIPELTIGESELLKIKNEQLQETVNVELKQKEFEILELQRQLAKVRTNPFMDMPQEKIEEFVRMLEDWKKFNNEISPKSLNNPN